MTLREMKIVIRCDGNGCPNTEEVETKDRRPPCWYHIKKTHNDGRLQPYEGFDLCSLRCVGRWAKARAEVIQANPYPAGDVDLASCSPP